MYLVHILLRNQVKFGGRKPNTGAVFANFAEQRSDGFRLEANDHEITDDASSLVWPRRGCRALRFLIRRQISCSFVSSQRVHALGRQVQPIDFTQDPGTREYCRVERCSDCDTLSKRRIARRAGAQTRTCAGGLRANRSEDDRTEAGPPGPVSVSQMQCQGDRRPTSRRLMVSRAAGKLAPIRRVSRALSRSRWLGACCIQA